MQLLEPLLFVGYYWVCLFCTEERLWAIFAKRPLHTLRTSWFGSRHFVVAYAVAILLFGVALPRSCEAMRRACLADHQCARRLTRDAYGWYDADDGQWRAYRGSFVTLLLAAAVMTAITRRIKAEKPTARLACGLAFVAVAHGGGAGCVVGVCGLFHAASFLPPALAVPAAWALALACLLAKDPALPYRRALPAPRWPVLGAGMYAWPDALPLLVLRLVSHVADAARARKQGPTTRPAGYDLQGCLAHALYAPLYVAGPVVAFDAFRNAKSKPISGSDVSYALRTLVVGGFLELVLRRCPAFALGASGAFRRLEAVDMAAFAFVTINVLWLKFCFMWRVARSWARFDGVDPPENMGRFVCDNFAAAGFWRGWHGSFNRWLVAYVYRPLLGAKASSVRRLAATGVVFAFVALWHDARPKLFVWGLVNFVLVGLERVVGVEARARRVVERAGPPAWDTVGVCALGAGNIVLLIGGNVVGYAVGVGGATTLLSGVFGPGAVGAAALAAWVVLGAGTFAALAVRRVEFFSSRGDNSNVKSYYTQTLDRGRLSSAYDA